MNHAINQKLISTSKIMLLILRILFILLILMSIIPWIVPNSEVGKTLYSIYGMSNYMISKNFDEVTNFTLQSRLLGFFGSIFSLFPLFVGVIIMIRLFKNYALNNIFSIQNAKLYSNLGIIYLLSALLLEPLSQILLSLSVSLNHPVGQRFIAISMTVNNLTAIFFAIMLIFIGQVMKLGQKISEEQELTI